MATLTIPAPVILPAGELIAVDVSADEYLRLYAETFHEWAEGVVIKMSPASARHTLLVLYLTQWFNAYFALQPLGKVLIAPFVMRLDAVGRIREPDLQIILHDNPGKLTDTGMIGPADLCIEIVSPESVARDYGDKFTEYEKAGVREYWIIDPIRQRCTFNRLSDTGLYSEIRPDEAGLYHTPLLPKLALHVPTLWQEPLPDILAVVQTVRTMLG
jgi:Uma2 family endonuclease